MNREKEIANVLRNYSRSKDKGTRAAVVERLLRLREENARPRLLALFDAWDKPGSLMSDSAAVDAILSIAREGE